MEFIAVGAAALMLGSALRRRCYTGQALEYHSQDLLEFPEEPIHSSSRWPLPTGARGLSLTEVKQAIAAARARHTAAHHDAQHPQFGDVAPHADERRSIPRDPGHAGDLDPDLHTFQ